MRRVEADGDESRFAGRGDTEAPSLSPAGEAAGRVGAAFSRKRLLTLREVNFLAAPAETWADDEDVLPVSASREAPLGS